MEQVDDRIIRFIKKHHVMTLAVSNDNIPYCASCFYVYILESNRFVFTSDPETRHIGDFLSCGHSQVAGTIALETRIIGRIRGIQFTGEMIHPGDESLQQARNAYLKRFPFARVMELYLWILDPDFIKLTDNRLGFGKKLIWRKLL
jgi:uncharacterized protein YhbP (UPF0306 family)